MACGDGVGKSAGGGGARCWIRCGAATQARSMGLRKSAVAAQGCRVALGRAAACRCAKGAEWCCTGALSRALLRRRPRKVRGMWLHRGAAWDRAGALCQAVQGRGTWLQAAQLGAGLRPGGGLRGRSVGLCRTGAGAWAGRGVAQGALPGAV